jgi:EmrB/QacA subfamily drug resistance transporter
MRLDYKWRAAIVVSIGLFMAILDNTIVSVALPQMQSYFHTDRETINWVATGYFLAQAAIIPITGYLSDRLGTKTVFLTALAFFTIGSGLCAVAPNEHVLIAFRVFQGIGGGALFPTAFAVVFRVFPPAERGAAGAAIGVPVLLAPAFGPTIGGFLTTTFDWHAIFTINLPVGIIAFVLAAIVLRGRAASSAETGEPAPDQGRFDGLGLLLAMAGFTVLVYGITEAGTYGWNDNVFQRLHLGGVTLELSVLRYLIAGGVLLIAFIIDELVVSDPVMDLRLFANYTFTATNVLTWVVSAFLFSSLFLLPIFFQNVQGHTPLESGEFVIVQGLSAAFATIISGRLYNRVGPRILTTIGFALVTAGTYGFTQLTPTTSWQSLQVWMVLRGLGLGFANIPLQTLMLSVVSNRAMARASSLANVLRQVFGAIGLTILTTIFVQKTTDYAATQTASVKAATQTAIQQATQKAVAQYTSGSPTDPTTPLGKLVATCSAPFGKTAPAHAPQIQACVQQATQQFAQQYGQTYAAQHAAQIAQQYAQQHVVPMATTQGLNAAFVISTIGCAVAIVLALFVGRDPNLVALKRAEERGETVQRQPVIIGE